MSRITKRLWLTPSEVADVFGVNPRTITRWIDEGSLPGYRLPGKRKARRVLRVKLIEFVLQRPEFHFALELLYGQPIGLAASVIPALSGHDPSEGYEAAPRSEAGG